MNYIPFSSLIEALGLPGSTLRAMLQVAGGERISSVRRPVAPGRPPVKLYALEEILDLLRRVLPDGLPPKVQLKISAAAIQPERVPA